MDESNNPNPTGLTVREDTWKGVYVEGLMENDVSEGHNEKGPTPGSDLSVPVGMVAQCTTSLPTERGKQLARASK